MITGDGVSTIIVPFNNYAINIQARDANNNNITTGGDLFYVEIDNLCSRNSVTICNQIQNSEQVVSTRIFDQMTDNGNGTYTYTYSVKKEGKFTLTIFFKNQNSVKADFYGNSNLLGNYYGTQYWPSINKNWGTGQIIGVHSQYVYAHITATIIALTTEIIEFNVLTDDGSNVVIDSTQICNFYPMTTNNPANSGTVSMIEEQYYNVDIKY